MTKTKRNSKTKLIYKTIFKFISLVAIIIMLIFSFYIYKLEVLPTKYLLLLYGILLLIYAFFTFVITRKRVKIFVKRIISIIFILNSIIFIYGIKYSDKLLDTLSAISKVIVQKEDYTIYVKSNSTITKETLNNKKIGVYKNNSYEKLIELLKAKYQVEVKDYDNPVTIFEDLDEGTIDAILINEAVRGLLDSELNTIKLELKDLDIIEVPIDEKIEEVVKVVDVTNTPFNIYIAGGDAYGKINKVMNTDVNMVVSVDPVNNRILLTSIPRDYYVNLPSKNAYDKLTHAGYYGVNESIKAVEELLDIDINYYVKVNFSTIEKIINAIGGVDVHSDYSFCATWHPDLCYKKGTNHMNGYKALMFARERHVFNDGDVQRVKNQQAVLTAVINKISSSKTLLLNYTKLMDGVSTSMATSLDSKSIRRLVNKQLDKMDGWTIEKQNLVGKGSSTKVCYSMPTLHLYVMLQDENSVNNARAKIDEFFGVEQKNNSDSQVISSEKVDNEKN